ncbi:hypothetical protein [Aquilutibacter rugosus]|uniref:hypothetical protein n=1 Tax=Aquilutibacter rugosus TaxID=3115820 RepID=UPI002F4168E3
MNNSAHHEHEPLTDEELALSRLLRSVDSKVAPSAELDSRVIAFARQATTKPRREHRWMQWSGLAATVALSAVALLRYQAVDTLDRQAEFPTVSASATSATSSSPAPALTASVTASAPVADQVATSASVTQEHKSVAATQSVAPAAAPKVRVATRASATASVSAPAAAPAPAPVAVMAAPPPPPMPTPAPVEDMEAGAAPTAARAAVPTSGADIASKAPKAWLLEIEQLLKDGEPVRARQELEHFRRTYPDVALPDSIKSLLAD